MKIEFNNGSTIETINNCGEASYGKNRPLPGFFNWLPRCPKCIARIDSFCTKCPDCGQELDWEEKDFPTCNL
jgi:hypothetical protein